MIKKPTVLVLGAGASYGYGYPLGAQLRADILSLTNSPARGRRVDLSHEPLLAEFVGTFKASRLYSIDAFLGLNQKYSETGKLAIAAILLSYESHSNQILRSGTQDWYDYLWNKITGEVAWDELNFANLSIVTFNYDLSLEAFLLSAIRGTYGVDELQAIEKLRTLKIVHVYGDLGSPWPGHERYRQYGKELALPDIQRVSKGLKVIPEARDDEPVFAEAKQLLANADAIGALGFGFDPLNLRRLDAAKTWCSPINRTPGGTFFRAIACSCMGRTVAEATADANHCKMTSGYVATAGLPNGFVDGDCLQTLRQTLILG